MQKIYDPNELIIELMSLYVTSLDMIPTPTALAAINESNHPQKESYKDLMIKIIPHIEQIKDECIPTVVEVDNMDKQIKKEIQEIAEKTKATQGVYKLTDKQFNLLVILNTKYVQMNNRLNSLHSTLAYIIQTIFPNKYSTKDASLIPPYDEYTPDDIRELIITITKEHNINLN